MADSVRTAWRLRPNEHRRLLVLGDLIASAGAMLLALFIWQQYSIYRLISLGVRPGRAESLVRIEVPIWFYLLPLGWIVLMSELYDPHAAISARRTVRGIVIAAGVGILAYSLAFILNREPSALPRIVVGVFIILAALLSLIWRLVYVRIYTSSGLSRRVLIVGAGKAGIALAHVYAAANPKPFSLIGFMDDDRRKVHKLFEGFAVLGTSRQLLTIIDQYRVSDLVLAITGEVHGGTFQMLLDAQERGVEIMRMPTVYEEITQRVPIHHLESDWIIRSFVDQSRVGGAYAMVKRLVDIIGGLIGLLLLLPLGPIIALVTILDSGAPVMYSQDRVGRGGRRFTIVKFRTMVQDADSDGSFAPAVEGDSRVTRVGRFLRRTHLDEFPQFWNVLRGDMSLVGPRAERAQLVAHYQKEIPFYRARLLVKPGLTGWAQINYGYVVDVKETAIKLEYDLYYIIHRSLVMDMSIVLRTIGTVVGRKGR
jgi:exopolysaccharide biosynthesis polyprenyl glycosylphosphotransferase